VYRADGSTASGSAAAFLVGVHDGGWNSGGSRNKSVTLGPSGVLSVDLVPNTAVTPAGSYYTVVFQLEDVVRTEDWLVGTTSPTSLSAGGRLRDRVVQRRRWFRGNTSTARCSA